MTRTRTAEAVHIEGERFEVRTGTDRTVTFGDVEAANEHSPVEIVLSALAACSAMDVIAIALKKRQNVVRYVARATGEQRDEYPQVLTRVELVHEIEGPGIDTAAIRRCIELSALKYCPVNAMLSAGATEIHHRFRISRPDQPVEEDEVVVTGPYRRPEPVP
jgi:putative redox protein